MLIRRAQHIEVIFDGHDFGLRMKMNDGGHLQRTSDNPWRLVLDFLESIKRGLARVRRVRRLWSSGCHKCLSFDIECLTSNIHVMISNLYVSITNVYVFISNIYVLILNVYVSISSVNVWISNVYVLILILYFYI